MQFTYYHSFFLYIEYLKIAHTLNLSYFCSNVFTSPCCKSIKPNSIEINCIMEIILVKSRHLSTSKIKYEREICMDVYNGQIGRKYFIVLVKRNNKLNAVSECDSVIGHACQNIIGPTGERAWDNSRTIYLIIYNFQSLVNREYDDRSFSFSEN